MAPLPPLTNQDLLLLIGDQTVTIAKLRARIHQLEAELATLRPQTPVGPVD